MMLWWCYDDVMMMLWWCYDDVMMMLWWCYDDGMMMLWWCYDEVIMMMLWWGYYDDVMMMLWYTPSFIHYRACVSYHTRTSNPAPHWLKHFRGDFAVARRSSPSRSGWMNVAKNKRCTKKIKIPKRKKGGGVTRASDPDEPPKKNASEKKWLPHCSLGPTYFSLRDRGLPPSLQ